MSRVHAVIVAAMAFFLPHVPAAAPYPKVVPQTLYFPTKVGTSWVHTYNGRVQSFTVTDVEEKGGAKLVTVAQVLNGGEQRFVAVMEVSENGVRLAQGGPYKHNPPIWRLKGPLTPGEKWDENVEAREDGLESKGTWVTRGQEIVVVPAGKYTAVRVDFEGTVDGRPAQYSQWYAPGIGLVKSNSGGKEKTLKSFTPGK